MVHAIELLPAINEAKEHSESLLPRSLSFDDVNYYINFHADFESLQYLCLTLAARLEEQQKDAAAAFKIMEAENAINDGTSDGDTASPWHFGKYADRVTATEDSDGTDSICHVYAGNQRANARLISAAPDLLEVWASRQNRRENKF